MELNADTQTGLKALLFFHNASLGYAAYQPRSTDELLAVYGKKGLIYAEGLGLAINANGMSQEQVKVAMESLAKTAQGRIPQDHNAYFHALQGEAGRVNYLDLTKTVAAEVVNRVADGAQAVGNSVITSLSWITTLLPYLAVGGVLFFVFNYTGGTAAVVKAMRKPKKKAEAPK